MNIAQIRKAHLDSQRQRRFMEAAGSALTAGIVKVARQECRDGISCSALANKYGTRYLTMYNAITGVTWKRVPGEYPNLGRTRKAGGEECLPHTTVLTYRKAQAIRARYEEGGISYAELGDLHGVQRGTIGAIVRCETWRMP